MTKTWSIGTSSISLALVSLSTSSFHSYELQVAASAQGKGLGKRLLMDLEKICKGFDMEKITLTVLKCKTPSCGWYPKACLISQGTANSKARSFYRSLGCVYQMSIAHSFLFWLMFVKDLLLNQKKIWEGSTMKFSPKVVDPLIFTCFGLAWLKLSINRVKVVYKQSLCFNHAVLCICGARTSCNVNLPKKYSQAIWFPWTTII